MKRFLAMFLTTGVVASAAPISGVPAANIKAAGNAPASQLTREWRQHPVAVGAMPLENPEGIIGWYGYQNDAPSTENPAVPQMVGTILTNTTPPTPYEAQKTEPDKNTYLVLWGQKGADPHYNYGSHFLFQGHEAGVKGASYITRINLDADTAHRVTLMATHDVAGNPIANIDGSTWDPFSQRLLFTTENANAPTYAATLGVPSQVEDVSGALGRGGYEGIQSDNYGNIWIVEDIGGPNKTDPTTGASTTARRPNSFVYRYVPHRPGDLHHGKLQVLQVMVGDHPATFESMGTMNAPDQIAIRTYGLWFRTRWVTVHDTAVDGNVPFNANTAAKAVQGTPFKRPENGVFRPGSHFREFFFVETGDTDSTSPENGTGGGWTSLFRLVQRSADDDEGRIALFFQSKSATVAGLDNVTFLSRDKLLAVEDAGDKLHGQRNALDSGFVFDVDTDYSSGAQPVRFLAEGRDASATLDSANGGFGKNDQDNEITGIHVSDGDPSVNGILGAKVPRFGHDGWRMFWTQQHGDNITWEVTRAKHGDNDDDHDDW
jgi:Bacterial protein of unknown function (DUF839)